MISGVEREGQDASQVPSMDTGAAVNRGGEHRGKGGSEGGPDTSLWHLAVKTSLFGGHGPPLGEAALGSRVLTVRKSTPNVPPQPGFWKDRWQDHAWDHCGLSVGEKDGEK